MSRICQAYNIRFFTSETKNLNILLFIDTECDLDYVH